jgi:hypothetical protein
MLPDALLKKRPIALMPSPSVVMFMAIETIDSQVCNLAIGVPLRSLNCLVQS